MHASPLESTSTMHSPLSPAAAYGLAGLQASHTLDRKQMFSSASYAFIYCIQTSSWCSDVSPLSGKYMGLCCVRMNSTPESAVALLVGVDDFPYVDVRCLETQVCLRSVTSDKPRTVSTRRLVPKVLSVAVKRNQGQTSK